MIPRVFVAITFDESTISALSSLRNDMKRKISDVKWVSDENFHITLKFLGDTDKSRLDGIFAAVQTVADGTKAFEFSLGNVGLLGPKRAPKAIVARVTDGDSQLAAMVNYLEEELSLLGFEFEERKFTPHVTLGRIRCYSPEIFDVASAFNIDLRQTVRSISVISSTLTPDGAIYDELAVYKIN